MPAKSVGAAAPRKTAAVKKAPAQKASAKTADTPASAAVSDPLTDFDKLATVEGLAAALVNAAHEIADACEKGGLGPALHQNLDLWMAIRTMLDRNDGSIPGDVRENLTRLSDYVVAGTLTTGRDCTDEGLVSLIDIDLRIAHGLIEATLNHYIRERAYFLWQEAGCPHGCDQDHWNVAEKEVRAAFHS